MSKKKRRTYSPITGKKYPKCSVPGCDKNVYADGKCYGHQPGELLINAKILKRLEKLHAY